MDLTHFSIYVISFFFISNRKKNFQFGTVSGKLFSVFSLGERRPHYNRNIISMYNLCLLYYMIWIFRNNLGHLGRNINTYILIFLESEC